MYFMVRLQLERLCRDQLGEEEFGVKGISYPLRSGLQMKSDKKICSY